MKLEALVDDRRLDALAERVAALEKRTSAEVVMVLRPQSGTYRDLTLGTSLVVSLVVLGALVYAPWEIPYDALVPIVLTLTGGAFGMFTMSPGAVRRIAGVPRLTAQTREGAEAAFARHEVWATRERTGLLMYYSHLERRLELLADLGIKAAIPTGELNAILHDFHQSAPADLADALGKAVDALAIVLERAYPRREGDTNERADRPVIEA